MRFIIQITKEMDNSLEIKIKQLPKFQKEVIKIKEGITSFHQIMPMRHLVTVSQDQSIVDLDRFRIHQVITIRIKLES